MKKVFFMVVAAMMIATTDVKANENGYDYWQKEIDYKMNFKFETLANYLNLKYDQMDALEDASMQLRSDIYRLRKMKPAKQTERMNQAIARNLRVAHKVLDQNQYRAYVSLLNYTFTNKGLTQILYMNDLAEK